MTGLLQSWSIRILLVVCVANEIYQSNKSIRKSGYITQDNTNTSQQHREYDQIVVPRPQKEPSIEHPFIFFHIQKCGGSTFRNTINTAAKAAGKKPFIPCHNGVSCLLTEAQFALPTPQTQSTDLFRNPVVHDAVCSEVIAGHFSTGVIPILSSLDRVLMSELIKENETTSELNATTQVPPSEHRHCQRGWSQKNRQQDDHNFSMILDDFPPFDCFVSIREPVSRFISHYYFFIEKLPEYHGRPLISLSRDEIHQLLYNKSFTGNITTNILSHHLSYTSNRIVISNSATMDWKHKVQEARSLLSRCIVGLTEEPVATEELMEAAFPWLKGHVKSQTKKLVNRKKGRHERKEDFQPDILDLLESSLQADIEVYTYGLNVFEKQLDHYQIRKNNTKVLAS